MQTLPSEKYYVEVVPYSDSSDYGTYAAYFYNKIECGGMASGLKEGRREKGQISGRPVSWAEQTLDMGYV
jgi:hypothetical protein